MRASLIITLLALSLGSASGLVAKPPVEKVAKEWTDAADNLMKTQASMQKQATKTADQAKATDLKASRNSAQESERAQKQEKEKNSQITEAIQERFNKATKDTAAATRNQQKAGQNFKEQIANQVQAVGKNFANQYEKASQSLELQKKESERASKAAAQQSAHEKQVATQLEAQQKLQEKEMQEFAKRNEVRANKKDAVGQKKATDAQREGQMKNWKQGLEKMLNDQHQVTETMASAQSKAERNKKDLMKILGQPVLQAVENRRKTHAAGSAHRRHIAMGMQDLYKAGSTAHKNFVKQLPWQRVQDD